MALTKCTASTDVIGTIGTTVQERGLTTQQFKDKFDEMPEGIKVYLNDTLTSEVDTHIGTKASTSALGHIKIGSAGAVDADGVYTPTGFKIGVFSRDTATATGTQAVTGVGFQPRAVIFFATTSAGPGEFSVGADSAVTNLVIANSHQVTANTYSPGGGGSSINLIQAPGVTYTGKVNSFDADGFTIGWTKTGAKVGTAFIDYIAFR